MKLKMNCYEIFKDGLKIIIKTSVPNLNTKMSQHFNGCFVISDYNEKNIPTELVTLDIVAEETIEYSKNKCFIMAPNTLIFSNKKNNIKFIYDHFNADHCLNLKRIIIDIFAKYYEDIGIYFVHGASVVNKKTNKATVFIGNSGSGKTTNLLFYLLSKKYDYMGNDRIGLRYYNGKLIVYGFPSNLGLRYPTLELNYNLKNLILPYIDKELYQKNADNCLDSKKLNLTVFNLLNAFNCKFVSKAELSEIIVTCYDKKNSMQVFNELLDVEEIISQIERQHISAISKEQFFLNELLKFNDHQSDFYLSTAKILVHKSNIFSNYSN